MKVISMFRTLIVLMIVLTFSTSFVTLAQQNFVRIEAEPAAAQDANAVEFEAKTAAERDASSDINKLLWFGAGVGACCIGGPIFGLAGGLVGGLIIPGHPSAPDDIGPFAVGCSFGFIASGLISLIGIYNYQVNSPPERLLGKSPEYIEFYINAYKIKTRSLRTKWAAAGAAAGTGLGLYLFEKAQ